MDDHWSVGKLTLHITSRNMKANSFRLHYFAHIFVNSISLGGMGNHFAILLLVMDFTIYGIHIYHMVYIHTDIWIYVNCVSLIPDC